MGLTLFVMKECVVSKTRDPLVQKLLNRMAERSEEGLAKYKVNMNDAYKPLDKWIVDAQEEAWDFIVYLEKIKTLIK